MFLSYMEISPHGSCAIHTSKSVLKDARSITSTIQEMWQGQLRERSDGGSRRKALEVTMMAEIVRDYDYYSLFGSNCSFMGL